VLDEDAGPGEGFGAELPVDWELAQTDGADGLGMRVVILRTGLLLKGDSGLLKQLLPPFKLGLGGPLAGGDQYMSWITLDDEVGIILWALDNDAVEGAINSTSPNPVTNKEFSKALGKAIGRPAFFPAPKLAVVALRGRELAEMVVGSARVIPRRAIDLGYRFKHPEIDQALASVLR
jgi:uncharacterized protein (TIGR01777 family)